MTVTRNRMPRRRGADELEVSAKSVTGSFGRRFLPVMFLLNYTCTQSSISRLAVITRQITSLKFQMERIGYRSGYPDGISIFLTPQTPANLWSIRFPE